MRTWYGREEAKDVHKASVVEAMDGGGSHRERSCCRSRDAHLPPPLHHGPLLGRICYFLSQDVRAIPFSVETHLSQLIRVLVARGVFGGDDSTDTRRGESRLERYSRIRLGTFNTWVARDYSQRIFLAEIFLCIPVNSWIWILSLKASKYQVYPSTWNLLN